MYLTEADDIGCTVYTTVVALNDRSRAPRKDVTSVSIESGALRPASVQPAVVKQTRLPILLLLYLTLYGTLSEPSLDHVH